MNPVTRSEGYAERLAILEDLGVQEKALIQDDGLDEVTVADNDQAKKHFYSRAFPRMGGRERRRHGKRFLMPLRCFLRAVNFQSTTHGPYCAKQYDQERTLQNQH